MTARTKGDLCALTLREEKVYGEIDASGTSVYAGTMISLDTPEEFTTEDIVKCGSLARGGIFRTGASCGFTATFNMVRGQGWQEWVRRAIGSLTGVQKETPSFDALFRIASDESILFTGSRVNTLTVSATQIGAPIQIKADAMSRWMTVSPFADSDGGSLSMDPVAIPLGVPVTFSKPWRWSSNGQDFQEIKGKSFTLTISMSLQGEPGTADPTSDSSFQLEAGEGSTPQSSEITLDITITSVGPEWDRMRAAFTTGLTFQTEIDGKTVTLSGCNLSPSMPSRSQSSYDETISVTATDIAITG